MHVVCGSMLHVYMHVGDVLEDETTDLSFDITQLVVDWNLYNKNEGELAPKRKSTTTSKVRTHLCESRKIEQGEVEHVGAAYIQMYIS
jgi:hypothetical protein